MDRGKGRYIIWFKRPIGTSTSSGRLGHGGALGAYYRTGRRERQFMELVSMLLMTTDEKHAHDE